MPISVKIGPGSTAPDKLVDSKPSPKVAEFELNMRKTLDGDIMIFDHADIDIMIMVQKGKIVSFAKDIMSEVVYGAQDRLFKYMAKKGLIKVDSVQGGTVYGAMEAEMLPSEELNRVNVTVLNISKWIDTERPYFEFVEKYEDMETERLTDPEEEDSTELGEVPHDETKGSMRPGYNYGPYWQSYTY